MQAVGGQSFLVVFDFDHTVVDCNTDAVIPAFLGREGLQKELIAKGMQWTKLMDTLIAPYTKQELVQAAAASVVMDPGMKDVFGYLRSLQKQHNPSEQPTLSGVPDVIPGLVEVNIASDANLLFIEASLDARLPSAKAAITQIHSNPYYEVSPESPHAGRDVCYRGDASTQEQQPGLNADDEAERDAAYNAGKPRRSRVCWYEPQGHSCECCLARGKPNMCKTRIIERLLSTTNLTDPTIIFIGDGANDYCPILNLLRPRDFMFAREGFPIHKILSATGETARQVGGCCSIGLWKNAADLLQLFRGAMDEAVRLPTLVRFRDVGPKEFRTVTIENRVADILSRTLAINDDPKTAGPGASPISNAGRALLQQLIDDVKHNKLVAPLPGQSTVPAWLRNYAYTAEYDRSDANPAHHATVVHETEAFRGVVPRWGQMPWLHGEIYSYHLLWQYLLLTDAGVAAIKQAKAGRCNAKQTSLNVITAHALSNPLYSQQCEIAQTPGMISPPVMPHQGNGVAAHLSRFPLDTETGIAVTVKDDNSAKDANAMKRIPFSAIIDPVGDSVIPPADKLFSPYYDIFAREKCDVLVNFLNVRVLPMLACAPWSAGESFISVLLRWMLWGNGLDLSMFTMEELTKAHGGSGSGGKAAGKGDDEAQLEALRGVERTSTSELEPNLVGNEANRVEAYLLNHIQRVKKGEKNLINHIDIVNDNVGVELVSDLCLGLWFLHHAASTTTPPSVTFHVKCMPYYVSDVTPRDFDFLLNTLEAQYGPSADPSKKEAMRIVLEPFVQRVRTAFASNAFTVEADTVWVQPSEYRDLPPRVVNRYFFTQTIAPQASQNISPETAAQNRLFRANKHAYGARSALVIFKGDLNYRRLVGDRYWNRDDFFTTMVNFTDATRLPPMSPEHTALMGSLTQHTAPQYVMDSPSFQHMVEAFWPTHVVPVCSIRTIKSECCLGVPGALKLELDQTKGKRWRVSGKYGVILFAS